MDAITVHVRENNTATLICPSCGAVRHVAAGAYRQARHTMNVRCRCQQVFTILLNFRRYFRKPTDLTGTYEIVSQGGVGGGFIHIVNLSRGGLGFTVSGLHQIKPGQELKVDFQLNDKNKTLLKKRALVRSVNENRVGCEFICNVEMERALGFFLQS